MSDNLENSTQFCVYLIGRQYTRIKSLYQQCSNTIATITLAKLLAKTQLYLN